MFSELSGSGETCFKLWCHYIIMELCADYFLLNCYEEIKKCQEKRPIKQVQLLLREIQNNKVKKDWSAELR